MSDLLRLTITSNPRSTGDSIASTSLLSHGHFLLVIKRPDGSELRLLCSDVDAGGKLEFTHSRRKQ